MISNRTPSVAAGATALAVASTLVVATSRDDDAVHSKPDCRDAAATR